MKGTLFVSLRPFVVFPSIRLSVCELRRYNIFELIISKLVRYFHCVQNEKIRLTVIKLNSTSKQLVKSVTKIVRHSSSLKHPKHYKEKGSHKRHVVMTGSRTPASDVTDSVMIPTTNRKETYFCMENAALLMFVCECFNGSFLLEERFRMTVFYMEFLLLLAKFVAD